MVVLTKKKKKKRQTPLTGPLHEKDLLRVSANVGSEMFSEVRSLVADSESTSQQTTKQPPGLSAAGSACKKLLRLQIGHDRSAVIIQRCAACP